MHLRICTPFLILLIAALIRPAVAENNIKPPVL